MARPVLLAVAIVTTFCAGCAHSVNTLDRVTVGMTRQEALQNVSATPEFVSDGTTEYVIYSVVTNLFSAYGDEPYSLLFVRLQNGLVVAKGVVGKREEGEIKRLDPRFDLQARKRS